MVKYISIGKFEKKYLIYVTIYLVGLFCLSNCLHNFTFAQKIKIFTKPHILMEFIIKNSILILFIIPELILNYIYRNKETKKINLLNPKGIMNAILCIIFFLLNHICEKILLYKLSLCYFQGPQILISFIISKYFFKNKFYRHQYFSLIIIMILLVMSNICDIYWSHNYYKKYSTSDFTMGFIFSLLFGIFQCFSEISYSKIFIEEYLFSPFKICYFFGFINVIIGIIVYIIASYIPSNYKYFQFIKYKNDDYFDNFKDFFEDFNSPGFFYGLFYDLIEIIFIIIVNLVIQKYTLSHIYFLFIITIFIHQIQVSREYLKNNKKFIYLMIISTIFFILEIFLVLIILEFFELNFFGLNKNLKKNIEKRAIEDINIQLLEEVKIYDDENYITKIEETNNINERKQNDTTLGK